MPEVQILLVSSRKIIPFTNDTQKYFSPSNSSWNLWQSILGNSSQHFFSFFLLTFVLPFLFVLEEDTEPRSAESRTTSEFYLQTPGFLTVV